MKIRTDLLHLQTVIISTTVWLLVAVTAYGTANYVYHAQTGDIQSGGGYTYLPTGSSPTDADTVYIRWKAEYNNYTDSGQLWYRYGSSGAYTGAGTTAREAQNIDAGNGNVDVYLWSGKLNPGTFHYKMESWHSGGGNTAYANGTSTTIDGATDFTLTVTDDDSTPPTLVEMRVDYNGTELASAGSGTSKTYTITDAELADIAGKNLKFKFAVWDASGLSRNASGSISEDMNYDIGTDFSGGLSGLEDIFATYDSTDPDNTANPTSSGTAQWSVFVHTANFSATEIEHLVTETDQGTTGKNVITISAPDNDNDRANDKSWQVNQQIGFLQVNDDDTIAPAFANATFSGKKLQIDITDASGIYDPGSGVQRLYMVYDDDGDLDDGNTDGTIDLSPLSGDTYQADSDLAYATLDGKRVTFRVYAYDNDAEYNSDRTQGIYNGSNLWGLNAPVAVAASATNSTSFTASWNTVTGADSYRLDVATDVNFSTLISGYSDKAVSGTSASVTGLSASTTYYYRLRATSNAGALSNNSNAITVLTPAPSTEPKSTVFKFK